MNINLAGITVSSVNMEDRKNLDIRSGDTVRVHQKIEDKGKTRLQVFEGLVLLRKHGTEPGATFTVRKVVDGIGVEKIFPLYSPLIDKIEIIRRSTVRRSKLYYIREKVAREIRRQMRRMHLMNIASESETETKARADAEAKAKAEAEAAEKAALEAAAKAAEEKAAAEAAAAVAVEAEVVEAVAEEAVEVAEAPEATEEAKA